jgi:prepilin-type N-terminal cleavage/methylation domain-containing protein
MCCSHLPHRPPVRHAFTLVELMISIALVLLLMLGINQVFKVTGEAVGTNQAISTGLRDARAVQAVFGSDLNAWAGDSPAIIVRSERVSAFRNKQDQLEDRDWAGGPNEEASKRTIDLDGDGGENNPASPGELIPASIYNFRSHRVDLLSFFGRGLFHRQTGGALPAASGTIYLDEYVADMAANEAWVWYGHLKRPDESRPLTGSNERYEHRDPGENPNLNLNPPKRNDRNFYASDFVLGRMAILLDEGEDTPAPPNGIGDTVVDGRGNRQRFIARTVAIDNVGPNQTDTLAPLKVGTQSNDQSPPNGEGPWDIQWSRYDLANTGIQQYRTILNNYRSAWDLGTVTEPWFDGIGEWRFQGDPQPLRPLTAANGARTTPVLLSACSQFIVEFAGDFIEQSDGSGTPGNTAPAGTLVDKDGNGTAYGRDGTVDFLIDGSVPGVPVRRIRWYGMPRDVAGNPQTGGADGLIRGGAGVGDPNQLVDVVPLRDVLGPTFMYTPPTASPSNLFIERVWPELSPGTRLRPGNPIPPPPAFYANLANGTGASRPDGAYIAAWGPDTADQPRPKMIRIVVTIDDPDGRIAEGQTFEYVYRVGG